MINPDMEKRWMSQKFWLKKVEVGHWISSGQRAVRCFERCFEEMQI